MGSKVRWVLNRVHALSLNLVLGASLAVSAQAETVTIAALGDSLTQGYGLVPQDGFVPVMQRYLAQAGADVVLINAGVSGDTTAGGVARIDWTLTEDVDAVIVALGSNDMLRGLAPEQALSNLDLILEKITAKGLPVLLIGVDAPPNYGVDYEQSFEAIYPALSAKYQTLFFPTFFEGLSRLQDLDLVMREHMQGDGIHPDASGVVLIVEAMAPKVLDLVGRAKQAE